MVLHVEALASERFRGFLRSRLRQSASIVVKRWRVSSMVPAFDRWRQFTQERRQHKREVIERTAKRLFSGELWQSWRVWLQHVEGGRVAALQRAMARQKEAEEARIPSCRARWTAGRLRSPTRSRSVWR